MPTDISRATVSSQGTHWPRTTSQLPANLWAPGRFRDTQEKPLWSSGPVGGQRLFTALKPEDRSRGLQVIRGFKNAFGLGAVAHA